MNPSPKLMQWVDSVEGEHDALLAVLTEARRQVRLGVHRVDRASLSAAITARQSTGEQANKRSPAYLRAFSTAHVRALELASEDAGRWERTDWARPPKLFKALADAQVTLGALRFALQHELDPSRIRDRIALEEQMIDHVRSTETQPSGSSRTLQGTRGHSEQVAATLHEVLRMVEGEESPGT